MTHGDIVRGARHVSLLLVLTLTAAACQSEAEPQASDTTASTTAATTTTTTAPTTTTTAPTTTTTTTSTTTTTTSLVVEVPEPIPIEPPEGFELVWNDEFDGEEINLDNWTFDIGGWGWGNGEAQYYTDRPENARVQDGLLIIEARFERFENAYYTSGRMLTQGLQEFQYGRFEARVKVPRGRGLWPAFWMLGADFDRNPDDPLDSNWPFVGEIDIMEQLGREPDLVFGTIHGPGYAGAGALGKWNRQEFDIADDWHTYAVEWDESGIKWFFDEEQYWEAPRDIVGPNREWVFDRPFFMILNLAVGGNFGGNIGLDTEFPAYLMVDHVRVYQEIADQ